ncbi:MAG TPA: hypothetical protein HA257_05550 [Candidatus Methanoperedenaceae archaeon]|nr:hypothetical protein [Candidatus Methanoperedenaceae archaeon]
MPQDYLKYYIYFISGSALITLITVIAEKKSPRTAGLLMSLPVITFLSLLFMALSQGAWFGSRAAVWNPIGAIADLVYMGLFVTGAAIPGLTGRVRTGPRRSLEILAGLLLGFSGYFLSIMLLSGFTVTDGWVSLGTLWVAAFIAHRLFGKLEDADMQKSGTAPLRELAVRALFGGCTVAFVVIIGDSAGFMWGGIFSSFPGTITPVLVILHLKYGKLMSQSVIKSAPLGLCATGLYSIMVWLTYPEYGIAAGTLVAYASVAVFLLTISGYTKENKVR